MSETTGITVTRGMSPWEAATQIFHPPGPGRGGGSIGFIAGRDGIVKQKLVTPGVGDLRILFL
jgi:hypothetical protein